MYRHKLRIQLLAALIFALVNFNPNGVEAQSAGAIDIRAIGAVCSAGFSLETQGAVDVAIIRLLGGIKSEGELRIGEGDLSGILQEFSDDQVKKEVYGIFKECVVDIVSRLSGFRVSQKLQIKDGNRLRAPDPIINVEPGQKFVMYENEMRSVLNESSYIYTVNTSRNGKGIKVRTVSPSGWSKGKTMYQGSELDAAGTDCSVHLYSVNAKDQRYSFVLRCRED